MFWFLAIISIVAYVVQGVLMTKYVRKIDPLSAGFYRNITFIITLLPLLFFAPFEKVIGIIDFWWIILLAAFLGAISQWTRFLALRILPVGIHTAVSAGLTTIFTFVFGFLLFHDTVTFLQLIFAAIILLGTSLFTLYKVKLPHLDIEKWILGFIYTFFTALIVAGAFILTAKVARDLNPLVAGYFWEILIGLASLLMIGTRYLYNQKGLEIISVKELGKIAIVCSPTLIGTGGFVLAASMGPVGIISAISASGIIIASLLSWIMYNEKLNQQHWIAIFIIIIGVVGIKVSAIV